MVSRHIKSRGGGAETGVASKGFTLIELLVVIVILGILAAVVVFAVNGVSDRGQNSACETDAQTLRSAVEAYRADDPLNRLPLTEAALVPTFLSSESEYYDYTNPNTYTGLGDCA